ncbi:DUF4040 domain-containing protein [Rhodobacteraceae bacterium 2376]|uniref:DUF4040 domain-containing protein n=1 Tax=Rhabdonatronobacter sediminivivens TaxID=2743469 RepID=A0A7Z0KYX7_9RHOB|nr:hydrogen gas-evolving membrane-bound hydrogenase subunit E [Rhabdonatronobacter sediminivivens]NYS25655.1 DUF4040 domain-containing protein [Rhabdonatronobacter sediminivivens]
MTDLLLLFDMLLGLLIIGLAVAALRVRDLFAMVVMFVTFGLMTALAWVRLAAPDVALAEAAIGTGVTGALLLKTLYHLRRVSGTLHLPEALSERPPDPQVPRAVIAANAVMCGLVVIGLAAAFVTAPLGGPGFDAAVADAMPESGVDHPVTAVLLNFRAYDTLMEVVVLLAAVIAVWLVERSLPQSDPPVMGEVYEGFARLVLPGAVVVGVYVLWAGAVAPGGAFQGGAVLAAVGLLLLMSHVYEPAPAHRAAARGLFVLGVAVFTGVALLVAWGGRAVFEYPPGLAKPLILLIEGMVTISIAATLAALFHGREPGVQPRPADTSEGAQ